MTRRGVLPGFGLSLGISWLFLGLVVLLPLSGIFLRSFELGWGDFWRLISDPRTLAALRLSFGAALAAAVFDLFFGLLVAWVLARYRFPGRGLVDASVDLPFALPTAVAGLTLTALYAPSGLFGAAFGLLGIQVAFAPLGIVVAMAFVSLPFVVRTAQPVLEELDPALEEAAAVLGATRWQTFRKVILPNLLPALLTGFALALARAIGEYGSIVFISGNMPMRTEIAPLLIVTRLEQYDYAGATALALVMLVVAFVLLLAINLLQRWSRKRHGAHVL